MMEFQGNLSTSCWAAVLREFSPPCQDVYFGPEYHELHAVHGDGQAHASLIREGEAKLLIPGMRSPVPELPGVPHDYWDLQTCNGYGGPVASAGVTRAFLDRAWETWREASAAQGMVAAFFRLHPLLLSGTWLPASALVVPDRQTVFVDLCDGLEAAWKAADGRHRNMVNKGRREGIRVSWNDLDGWEAFEKLYGEAMIRMGASSRLCFSPEYFAALRRLSRVYLATVYQDGELAAGAVFFFGPCWAHYHLAVYRPGAANHLTNCILQAALAEAAQQGLLGMHLGGGRTNRADDSLLKFKSNLGGRRLDFRVALVVVNRHAYDQLGSAWSERSGQRPAWLLGYRQPLPDAVISSSLPETR